MRIDPFLVEVPDDVLADLRARLARTRFPATLEDSGWDYGTDLDYLRRLVEYWRDGYDWRAQESALNRLPAFPGRDRGPGDPLRPLRVAASWRVAPPDDPRLAGFVL